jgi:acetyl esterase/lipase
MRHITGALLLGALVPLAAACAGATETQVDTPGGQGGAAVTQVDMPVSYDQVLAAPSRAPDAEMAYGDSPSQRVLVWRAQGVAGRAPVVILLHGGCWLAQYGVEHVAPLATALAASGYAVWAPEYRRVGEEGGGWPGTFDDVTGAIQLLEDTDDPALDRGRSVLVGHSAGGHLALWAGATGALEPLAPRGVVGLAAITDLAASYARGGGGCAPAAPQLMGGTPGEQPERYAQASPAALPTPVPVVLLQGSADPIVPLSQASALSTADLQVVPGAGHFDMIHPGTAAFPALLQALRRLASDG